MYTSTMNTTFDLPATLTPAARERLATRLAGIVVGSVESTTAEWYGEQAGPRTPCYGFYDGLTRRIFVAADAPNVDLNGVVAHELGHVLDQDDACETFDLSFNPEFKAAWRAEMSRGQLTPYAATDEVEGFAELARHLYTGVNGIRERFPRCVAYFARNGLI